MPRLSSSSEPPSKVSRITVPVACPKPRGLYMDMWMGAQEQSMWPCVGRAGGHPVTTLPLLGTVCSSGQGVEIPGQAAWAAQGKDGFRSQGWWRRDSLGKVGWRREKGTPGGWR